MHEEYKGKLIFQIEAQNHLLNNAISEMQRIKNRLGIS